MIFLSLEKEPVKKKYNGRAQSAMLPTRVISNKLDAEEQHIETLEEVKVIPLKQIKSGNRFSFKLCQLNIYHMKTSTLK